ncbi:G protein-coupled receptor rhodopsin-like [Trinorchestia longiramus]|nr:G protein-coupled receptor rhodopsin-like [Trinorchestia longiramus]
MIDLYNQTMGEISETSYPTFHSTELNPSVDELAVPWISDYWTDNNSYSAFSYQFDSLSNYWEFPMNGTGLQSSINNISLEHFPFNFPLSEVYNIVKENNKESYLGPTAKIIIMVAYITLIVVGTAGNILVGIVIARKQEMRTAGNLYVINLTISDITLCLICMPFTLASLMKKNWELGSFICKLVPILQCSNILVSTATIAAIAADRYMTIVRIGTQPRSKYYNQVSVLGIWIVSLIFPLPLFSAYYLEPVRVKDFLLYERCVELWSSRTVQMGWMITLFLIQYVTPILVLVFVHIHIKNFLNKHKMHNLSAARKSQELDRNRRTTILLTTIACTFAVSWLPWHVVNLLADFNYFQSPEYFYAVFGACHILAMSTACSNPVLYGWLNTNLKREILIVLSMLFKTGRRNSGDQRNASTAVARLSCQASPCPSLPRLSFQSAPSKTQDETETFSVEQTTLSPNTSFTPSSVSEVTSSEPKVAFFSVPNLKPSSVPRDGDFKNLREPCDREQESTVSQDMEKNRGACELVMEVKVLGPQIDLRELGDPASQNNFLQDPEARYTSATVAV